MAVNEKQLETWSNRGAATTAEATYTSIKAALGGAATLKKYDYDVYLQGSYGNATNIYGNSDVDVIVELNSAYYADISRLSEAEKIYHNEQWTESKITFVGFRDEVQQALESYYGKKLVTPRNKCIAIAAASGRLDADVVPCLEHRLYTAFTKAKKEYVEGIKFFTRNENREVINYPKPHRENGAAKNQRVDNNYKPVIRIFKNWRDRLIADKTLKDGVAPSYFVECLMSNIPDAAYLNKSWQSRVLACLNHLHGVKDDMGKFTCQSGATWLFGTTPDQWTIERATTFVNALIEDWNRGR